MIDRQEVLKDQRVGANIDVNYVFVNADQLEEFMMM